MPRPTHLAALVAAFTAGALATAALDALAGPPSPPPRVAAAASVLELPATELRIAPSGKSTIRLLARGDNAFLGLLWMEAGAAVPEHSDPTEEYIHVLEGGGTLTIDGAEHRIGPGSTILMPAGSRVTFRNGPEPLRALQVFAGPGPADKYATWKPVTATNPGRPGPPGRRAAPAGR